MAAAHTNLVTSWLNQTGSSAATAPLEYRTEIESKTWRITRLILQILILPWGLASALHSLIGRVAIFPSSWSRPDHYWMRSQSNYREVTLHVDGLKISALLIKKPETSTASSDTPETSCVIYSGGFGTRWETQDSTAAALAQNLHSHVLMINHPGMGASTGWLSRSTVQKAYQAAIRFATDEWDGVGAKKVILWGHSQGAAVQSEVVPTLPLLTAEAQKGEAAVKYVIVSDRTSARFS